MRAIIVDDSRAMRRILRRIVERHAFDAVEAGDGAEALAVLDGLDAPPDLALVDWNMPVMDGLAFVTAVRAQAHLRRMAVVMVTTESEHSQIVRALAAGAHEYVIKPFTAESLDEKLALLGLVPNGERA